MTLFAQLYPIGDFLRENWKTIFWVANYFFVIIASITILYENRNPAKTAAYLLLLIFLPVIGLVIYMFFGQDLRKRKLFNRKSFHDSKLVKEWSADLLTNFQAEENVIVAKLGQKIKIARMLMHNNEVKSLPTLRNEVTVFHNGEEKYPVLLEELQKATHHIHIEYYIMTDGWVGQQVRPILIEKAKAGVKVRIIYDPIGSSMNKEFLGSLQAAGVEMHAFMPVIFTKLADRANYRDHRKIVVIDGRVGFVGGINLADEYLNDGHKRYWRDTHLMIRGEAARNLQLYFLLNWHFVSGQRIRIDQKILPPEILVETQTPVQIVGSGPDNYWPAIEHVFMMAASTARRSICIANPYFIPTEGILTALQTAALGGVEVNIMMPEKGDHKSVTAASFSFITPLLRSGVNVYLYTKGFLHSKVMVVDEIFSTLGSCNFDSRSFSINLELNAVIYDRSINRKLRKDFEEDLKFCKKLHLATWEKRPLARKTLESACRIIAPIL
jgi:cardiolipin synthase